MPAGNVVGRCPPKILKKEKKRSNLYFFHNCSRYTLTVRRAEFNRAFLRFTQDRWFHIVFNYLPSQPPNEGQGFTVYHDGVMVTDGPTGVNSQPTFRAPAKDTRIVIGRRYTGEDRFYSSLIVDELIFYNRPLREMEIAVLSH